MGADTWYLHPNFLITIWLVSAVISVPMLVKARLLSFTNILACIVFGPIALALVQPIHRGIRLRIIGTPISKPDTPTRSSEAPLLCAGRRTPGPRPRCLGSWRAAYDCAPTRRFPDVVRRSVGFARRRRTGRPPRVLCAPSAAVPWIRTHQQKPTRARRHSQRDAIDS
jgi:hypothetical protein